MPRPLRIEYEGAWYHVMNRGTNHQNIFETDDHRIVFLSLLKEICKKFRVEIHSYCLMDNHYHLLIRTPLANLGKAMQFLDGIYTQRFNRSTIRDGSLFRGRYKSILLEEDCYLLQVSRYIHLNPVAAHICNFPHEYVWSSYNLYIEEIESCNWLHRGFILSMMSQSNKQTAYAEFVNDGSSAEIQDFYNKKRKPSILGSKKFVEDKLNSLDSKYKDDVLTDFNATMNCPDIETIVRMVSQYYQVNMASLFISKHGVKNHPRLVAMHLSKTLGLHTHQAIADFFLTITRRGVSTALSKCKNLIASDLHFKSTVNDVSDYIKKSYITNNDI